MNKRALTIAVRKQMAVFKLQIEHHFSAGITAVVGPSGAGKTTLLHMIAGLSKPDGGVITLGEQVVFDSARNIWVKPRDRKLGYVFQDVRLFPHMTVEENIRFPLQFISPIPAHYTIKDIIDATGIGHLLNRYPEQLSGGEQQRVALARALLRYPQWLLLDEPMGALDIGSKLEFLYFLTHIHNRFHLPMVIVSHDLDTIFSFSHEVVFIDRGKILAAGKPFEVVSQVVQHMESRASVNAAYDIHPNYHNIISARAIKIDSQRECLVVGDTNWQIYLPQTRIPVNSQVLLHIPSNEIILAKEFPRQISANTILEGEITNLEYIRNRVFVTVNCGVPLVAEVVPGTVKRLSLKEGQFVYLILKATSIRILRVWEDASSAEVNTILRS